MTTEPKLTIEQLDSLNDREMDALVVEMITHESTCPWHGAFPADDVPLYSTDTTLVSELVTRWNKDNPDLAMKVSFAQNGLDNEYVVVICKKHDLETVVSYKISNQLHRAICIAILLAEQEK